MDALQQCAQNYARLCGYATTAPLHARGTRFCCGCSLFVNDVRDYSARQTKFTLLQKKKIHRETGAETLLYRRETYHPE